MTTISKRVQALEKQFTQSEGGSCLVLVSPDQNADERRREELAAFVAQYGHEPTIVSVVQFVAPNQRNQGVET